MNLIDTYRSLCTEFYDLDKPLAPPAAFEFILKEISQSSLPILEPMCGSGRFLIPLLEQGFDIDGTDASHEMLDSCRKRCEARGLNPNLYYQRIQEISLPRKYGLIIIPSGSFGLITESEEVEESLKRLYACMKPGGKLMLELLTSYQNSHVEVSDKREVIRDNSSKIILNTTTWFDEMNNLQIMKCDYQNLENDRVTLEETELIKLKLYDVIEFSDLLRSNGFSEIEAIRPHTEETATEQDDIVLFRCKRPTA